MGPYGQEHIVKTGTNVKTTIGNILFIFAYSLSVLSLTDGLSSAPDQQYLAFGPLNNFIDDTAH